MEKIKLSELPPDTKILVNGDVITVEDILALKHFRPYKEEEMHTVTLHYAAFNAQDILEDAIETEYCNGMYEDWDEVIRADVKDEDIKELQEILDRILARDPSGNTAYVADKLIEYDIG